MNRFIYLYKAHIERVVDGRTFAALVDLGFDIFKSTTFQLAGLDLGNPRKEKGERKDYVNGLLAKSKDILDMAFYWPDGQGRSVLLSPHTPDKFGRTHVNVYIPCQHENIDYPQLTKHRAGQTFINIVCLVQLLLESRFNPENSKALFEAFDPVDFDL